MDREYRMMNTQDDGVKAVAKDFVAKYRAPKDAPLASKLNDDAIAQVGATIVTAARSKAPRVASKKSQARALFVAGNTAAEVASIMEITYANAHYYLRAFRKAGGDIGVSI